jgi:hypothetical protein
LKPFHHPSKKLFKIGYSYINRGPNYKRFDDDQFGSWLVDFSKKTIPPIGGIRFKKYVDFDIKLPDSDQLIPPYIILISTFFETELNNPWLDKITPSQIIYWGDANGTKDDYMSYKGNKALHNVSNLLNQYREMIPPILHFSSHDKGVLTFNGLCALDSIKKDKFFHKKKNIEIDNLLCTFKVFKTDVNANWLVQRANSDPTYADKILAPKYWNSYLRHENSSKDDVFNNNKTKKIDKNKKLIWNTNRNTVLMWILYHNGFSITDDSNPANQIIAEALNVKRSSLDMMARHIKHHLFRLDLYGKKFRGSASLIEIIDKYRPDLRDLKKDAVQIAKLEGWYESLKDYL